MRDDDLFSTIIDDIGASDGVIWAPPVFIFLIPAQYKLYIELLWKKKATRAFSGKYTTVLTTSIHFFDHTAHNYMRAVCEDLGMKYIDYFSADSFDLKKEQGPEKLVTFFEFFIKSIEQNIPAFRNFPAVKQSNFTYSPGDATPPYMDIAGRRILILSDRHYEQESNMYKMIDTLKRSFNNEIETSVIDDIKIKGACLGCVMCGYDNNCVYTGKDEFIDFYDTNSTFGIEFKR